MKALIRTNNLYAKIKRWKKICTSMLCMLFGTIHLLQAQTNIEKSGKKNTERSFNGSPLGNKPRRANLDECPIKVPVKPDGYDVVTPKNIPIAKSNLIRSTKTHVFQKIELHDITLDIPLIQQFKNNKTEFTPEGEAEFNELIKRIEIFLKTNNPKGKLSIKITGSASQIPTSFDPSRPNNNLRPDGSSIPGKTSIANNKLLAKARADAVATKLHKHFPSIHLEVPTLDEIKLGPTPWTDKEQNLLIEAMKKKDRGFMDKIFEPYQKEQFVKLESSDRTSKTIYPEALKMYMISTSPPLKSNIGGKEESIKTIFIVSKSTYDKAGETKTFPSIHERDLFLRKNKLKIFQWDRDSIQRWYLLSGNHEIKAFNTPVAHDKIIELYKVGIADIMDSLTIDAYIKDQAHITYLGKPRKKHK